MYRSKTAEFFRVVGTYAIFGIFSGNRVESGWLCHRTYTMTDNDKNAFYDFYGKTENTGGTAISKSVGERPRDLHVCGVPTKTWFFFFLFWSLGRRGPWINSDYSVNNVFAISFIVIRPRLVRGNIGKSGWKLIL